MTKRSDPSVAKHQAERLPQGSLHVRDVLHVRNILDGLVGVPIDKNRILYFCDALSYRERLISVFIEDDRHSLQDFV
jgi:hypothetical protein